MHFLTKVITAIIVIEVTIRRMQNIIIVFVNTATSVEEKKDNVLIFNKKSLLAFTVRIVVNPFTDRIVLQAIKASCVSELKSVPSAAKPTSFQRKENSFVENTSVLTVRRKCYRTISATLNRCK